MPPIVKLIERDLSEPYSIFTYRYFINNWPNLCFLVRRTTCLLLGEDAQPWPDSRVCVCVRASCDIDSYTCVCLSRGSGCGCRTQAMSGGECVGTIVCKLDTHGRERTTYRGYIAMLAVRKDFRKKGIGEAH